uniref:Uncharacterized protein n=1 Tax=Nothobranchius furzeri TaxID=105023 RepID=A0A1A8VE93_NOTFU
MEPMTAASLLSNVAQESASSFVALQMAHSFIFHDQRGPQRQMRVCVLCENKRMCLCSRSADVHLCPFLSSPWPFSTPGRSIYIRFKVYTLFSSSSSKMKTLVSLNMAAHRVLWSGQGSLPHTASDRRGDE